MDQSQTPGDLAQHPEYDSKKILDVLKEKLTREGLDNSRILVKLKEAHDAIERACDACMLTDEEDRQIFWDDHTFFYYYYWLESVERKMRMKGSSGSEVSDAEMEAERAILAAKEACTTDTERAELARIKNLEGDESGDKNGLGEDFEDAGPEYGFKDRLADFEEKLICKGVDKSEISMRLKKAEDAIEHVYSVCDFTDEEKRIFRHDVYGEYYGCLVDSMLRRLSKSGYNADALDEVLTRAYKAIWDAEAACGTYMRHPNRQPKAGGTGHQADEEKDGRSCKRVRMN